MDFAGIAAKIRRGGDLIRQGGEVLAEVRENIAAAEATLVTTDIDRLKAMLDEQMAESEALSARIQRA